MVMTHNFRLEEDAEHVANLPSVLRGEYVDSRTNIHCMNPGFDQKCYVNYIAYLNDILLAPNGREVNYGFLELGLVPATFLPSFMVNTELENIILTRCSEKGLPTISLPPMSPTLREFSFNGTDFWCKREDVEAKLGIPRRAITIPRLLEALDIYAIRVN